MPKFDQAPKAIRNRANTLLGRFESHHPIVKASVMIDIVMVSPDYDEHGAPVNDALKKNGVKALGVTRKLSPKDRAMGRGDAEICLDADWWKHASEQEQDALLDHELHHIALVTDKFGAVLKNDDGRPKITMRHHDFDVGWFTVIAERHGVHSLEVQQATHIYDAAGQSYWPSFFTNRNPAKKEAA